MIWSKITISLIFLWSALFVLECDASEPKPSTLEVKNIAINPKQSAQFLFDISFSNINIGHLSYEVNEKDGVVSTKAKLKTNSFYDFIFKIRDEINSLYINKNLRPSEFTFFKKEGKKESYVKMNFDKDQVQFFEKWKKEKKSGEKKKTISLKGKSYFDILSLINRVIFSNSDFKEGNYFWLSLKENIYKVVLKNLKKIKVVYKKKKIDATSFRFTSFKDDKEEKKGEFSIIVLPSEKPILYEIQGHLKIGKIKGVLKSAK